MNRSLFSRLSTTAFLAISASSHANILVNGSFENPVLAAESHENYFVGECIGTGCGPGIPSWIYGFHNAGPFLNLATFVVNGTTPIDPPFVLPEFHSAPFGNQFYYAGGTHPYTTITNQGVIGPALGHYELSFWQSDSPLYGTGGVVGIDFQTATGAPVSLLGGRQTFTTALGSDWVQHSVEFDITLGGDYSLKIYHDPGHYALIDNVQLALAPSAAPEPGIYAMMLVGLGAMGWARRRRKQ